MDSNTDCLANDFRVVFWVSVIPGLMAVALLLFGVCEPERHENSKRTNPIRKENLKRLGTPYWWVVGVGAAFTLAQFSEAFLVLRTAKRCPIAPVPLLPLWQALRPHEPHQVAGHRFGYPDCS